jgi:hypothetical protein
VLYQLSYASRVAAAERTEHDTDAQGLCKLGEEHFLLEPQVVCEWPHPTAQLAPGRDDTTTGCRSALDEQSRPTSVLDRDLTVANRAHLWGRHALDDRREHEQVERLSHHVLHIRQRPQPDLDATIEVTRDDQRLGRIR